MRVDGWCYKCRRVRRINIATGLCTECEEKKR